jgi:serine/threonine-protein kinase
VTVGLFGTAAVLAAALVLGGDPVGQPRTPLAVPPSDPAPTTAPSTTDASAISAVSGTDDRGFIGHTARCDGASTPAALIRTAQSLAIICETRKGDYYYRGERLRDGANLRLKDARPLGAGFVAVNPADGARYEVMPDLLTISSNGRVDSAEPAVEFGAAG